MRKSILICILITLLISGCSPKTVIPPTEDKSKITNINNITKKWILKEFWIFPNPIKPLSKDIVFNK